MYRNIDFKQDTKIPQKREQESTKFVGHSWSNSWKPLKIKLKYEHLSESALYMHLEQKKHCCKCKLSAWHTDVFQLLKPLATADAAAEKPLEKYLYKINSRNLRRFSQLLHN